MNNSKATISAMRDYETSDAAFNLDSAIATMQLLTEDLFSYSKEGMLKELGASYYIDKYETVSVILVDVLRKMEETGSFESRPIWLLFCGNTRHGRMKNSGYASENTFTIKDLSSHRITAIPSTQKPYRTISANCRRKAVFTCTRIFFVIHKQAS